MQPRPPHPDSLVNKYAYQGFKSRRQREAEAKKIAEELKTANFQIIEVMSPLMNLQEVAPIDDCNMLRSCARNPSLHAKLASTRPEEQSEPRETSKWLEYDEFVNCFTLVNAVCSLWVNVSLLCVLLFMYRTLHVLHKPGGYKAKQAVQDINVCRRL